MSEKKVLHEFADGIELVKTATGELWLLHDLSTFGECMDSALQELARLAAEVKRLTGIIERDGQRTDSLVAENETLRTALEGYECTCESEASYAGYIAKTYVCPRCAALEDS